jgi:hypothetical protein
MQLQKLDKIISKAYIATASTLVQSGAVRELDEESKGRFVAYVDEGKESYDVLVELDAKQNVVTHTCDCTDEYLYCAHKTAVLLTLQGSVKAKKKAEPKIKQTPEENLLQTLELEDLRRFVRIVLKENKQLRLQFLSNFKGENIVINQAELNAVTTDIVKQVLGQRRNPKQSDRKRIGKLLLAHVSGIKVQVQQSNNAEQLWQYVFAICCAVQNALVYDAEQLQIRTEGLAILQVAYEKLMVLVTPSEILQRQSNLLVDFFKNAKGTDHYLMCWHQNLNLLQQQELNDCVWDIFKQIANVASDQVSPLMLLEVVRIATDPMQLLSLKNNNYNNSQVANAALDRCSVIGNVEQFILLSCKCIAVTVHEEFAKRIYQKAWELIETNNLPALKVNLVQAMAPKFIINFSIYEVLKDLEGKQDNWSDTQLSIVKVLEQQWSRTPEQDELHIQILIDLNLLERVWVNFHNVHLFILGSIIESLAKIDKPRLLKEISKFRINKYRIHDTEEELIPTYQKIAASIQKIFRTQDVLDAFENSEFKFYPFQKKIGKVLRGNMK